jgi:serine/threonine-protein kinase
MGDDRLIGRRLGGFEVEEVVGRGGFATVYRARQVRLGRDVALKVLDPMLARNADAARRFDREGWAAAGLDHPGIVPVYEAGEEDGIWYLAMRLVAGHPLSDELAGADLLPPERTLAVVRAVGEALDHAHSRGVLHRDVKPANILVEDDRVWLSDFGIAATAQQAGVYTAGALGTAAYMAPEQARPGEADFRADLYALGCLAYECVTGHPPFADFGLAGTIHAHAHEPVPSTGDPALDGFFARALAKPPDARFQSGAELADALDAVIARPGPPTRKHRGPRPRRGRVLALGALAGAVAAVVALLAIPGSGGHHATTTTSTPPPAPTTAATMTKAQAAAAYDAAVAPVNSAQVALVNNANSWNASTTGAQAQSQAQPLLAAIEAVQSQLLTIAATYAPAAADLRADADAAAQIRRDVLGLARLNTGITVATWRQQYDADIARLIAASNTVRSDLGLRLTSP